MKIQGDLCSDTYSVCTFCFYGVHLSEHFTYPNTPWSQGVLITDFSSLCVLVIGQRWMVGKNSLLKSEGKNPPRSFQRIEPRTGLSAKQLNLPARFLKIFEF